MKFAFLVHPLSRETAGLSRFDPDGELLKNWGTDPAGVAARAHAAVDCNMAGDLSWDSEVCLFDDLGSLASSQGRAEGRIYQIPLDAMQILENPDQALAAMEEAVEMAADWGARLVGLGSMTGIVGSRGEYLAERSPVAVTTGNSLTVYTALQNLFQVAEVFDIDLKRETVAMIGVPGSIISAVAALAAPHCGRLLLVGRNGGTGAVRKLVQRLGGEYLSNIDEALAKSRVVVSATSSGNCIDQRRLLPGTVVIDVGVPTDVIGNCAQRPDVLILSGGLVHVPETMRSSTSRILRFHHGVIPSCLGETLVLALEDRPECLSLGRELNLDAIQSIGMRARDHGFDFSQLNAFGLPLEHGPDSAFRRARWHSAGGRNFSVATTEALAPQAAARHARHCNPVLHALSRSSGFVKTFVRGEGIWLYDERGKAFLDCVSGFGALNLGHNHPAVVQAIGDALRQQAPGFVQSAVNPYQGALAADLATLAPPGLEMVFFCNSGTESVEAALKLARLASGREKVLSCEGGFHGKTMGALSVTGTAEYRKPFAPLLGGCETIPAGDEELLERTLSSRQFAAFIIEPVQGEAGIYPMADGFLRAAAEICRRTGTLLIVDEVQTGLGRTGAMFACEHEGIEPDILCLAKSLGGGLMPIGAMLTRRELWMRAYGTVQTFALHTSTFGGGSLACAAGLATLHAIRNERLAENAAARGGQLLQGLTELRRRMRCLKAVRGRGLLIGLEFSPLPPHLAAHWRASDPTGVAQVFIPQYNKFVDAFPVLHALQTLLNGHGVYAQMCRSNPFVLRIQPPLMISENEAQRVLSAIEQTCEEIDLSTSLISGAIGRTTTGEHGAASRHTAEILR